MIDGDCLCSQVVSSSATRVRCCIPVAMDGTARELEGEALRQGTAAMEGFRYNLRAGLSVTC